MESFIRKLTTKNIKWIILDSIIIVLSLFQTTLLIINACGDVVNLGNIIFYINYILIACVIASLVIRGRTEHFLAIIFFLCFFIFLMGQKLFMAEKNVFLTFARTELNHAEYNVFLSIIFIGIVVTYFAYLFACGNNSKRNNIVNIKDYSSYYPIIRLFYLITLPCAVYMQLKIVIVRSALSYTDSYLTNVDVPAIIKIGYYLFSSISLLYLALKPPKKDVYFIIAVLLLIEGGVQLLQGRRALFATTLLFIVWYLLKYYKVEKINLKIVLGVILGGVLLVVLFYFVEMQRSNVETSTTQITDIIQNFMISTGGSDSVIGNTIAHSKLFPKAGFWYLVDPIVNNPVFNIISGKGGISQGNEYLESFNSFSHWISYLTESSLYYSGHGMGSCYLAEVYLAFKLPGVFVISIVIGIVIHIISKNDFENYIFLTTIEFVLVKNLFTLPRSGLFGWFGDFTYLVVTFCIVYLFHKIYSAKDGLRRKR